MRVLIIGAGAVGLVYAKHLAEGGAEVSLYVRPSRLEEARAGYDLTRVRMNMTAVAQRVRMRAFLHEPDAVGWLEGAERRRSRLVPGQLADLVVLDRDPFDCPPEELPEIGVVATMVGGRWVHNPPPWG